ncbi:hypothetical protein H8959_007724 [Pygathrix nigripes]
MRPCGAHGPANLREATTEAGKAWRGKGLTLLLSEGSALPVQAPVKTWGVSWVPAAGQCARCPPADLLSLEYVLTDESSRWSLWRAVVLPERTGPQAGSFSEDRAGQCLEPEGHGGRASASSGNRKADASMPLRRSSKSSSRSSKPTVAAVIEEDPKQWISSASFRQARNTGSEIQLNQLQWRVLLADLTGLWVRVGLTTTDDLHFTNFAPCHLRLGHWPPRAPCQVYLDSGTSTQLEIGFFV